jgi:peptide/nickel transport system substrate-binding protein
MENRFGVKDFVFTGLLVVLIIIVALGMKQYDREWTLLQTIQKQGEDQAADLAGIHRQLEHGIAMGNSPAQSGTLNPTTEPKADDPFARVEAAQKMPGYAQGDWLVDSGPNSDRLTPIISGDTFAAGVQSHVLESLLERDPVTLEYKPLLAEPGWEIEDHVAEFIKYRAAQEAKGMKADDVLKDPNRPVPLRIKFKLRPNLTFSDGKPLTAADVVWTFNWIMNPDVSAARDRSVFDKIRSVKQMGDLGVVFEFNEPYFDALGLAGEMPVLSKAFYGAYSPDSFNKIPGLLLGSGPYRMIDPTSWTTGQQVVLVRNDRYWGDQPAFDRLVFNIIDNDLSRLTAFTNGELDTFTASPEQYESLLKNQDVLARTRHFEFDTPTAPYMYIAWNEMRDGKPTRFADKRVRQAMTMLTNRQRICDDIMLGLATPATGPFSRLGKQCDPTVKPWSYDVERAKALLKEAGYTDDGSGVLKGPDGKPFTFRFTFRTGSPTYDQIALFLKDSYARAGITLEADRLDWSVFRERMRDHDFDVINLGWSTGVEDDIYQMFDSHEIPDGGDDYMSYRNPRLDQLIEQARETIDPAKRMPLWHECHRILHEDQPYTFLFTPKSTLFVAKRIANVQKIPLGLNSEDEWFVPLDLQKWSK